MNIVKQRLGFDILLLAFVRQRFFLCAYILFNPDFNWYYNKPLRFKKLYTHIFNSLFIL